MKLVASHTIPDEDGYYWVLRFPDRATFEVMRLGAHLLYFPGLSGAFKPSHSWFYAGPIPEAVLPDLKEPFDETDQVSEVDPFSTRDPILSRIEGLTTRLDTLEVQSTQLSRDVTRAVGHVTALAETLILLANLKDGS